MKRTRPDTEKIVSDALKEEVAEKDKKKKGKRVRFSDAVETKQVVVGGPSGDAGPSCEGPVREELSEVAQAQRALARKGMGKEDDVEWLSDVRGIEEDLVADEEEEEGGDVTLEPFNLKEEREEGDFQDDGFYVRRQDADLKDAWLSSDEAKVCSSAAKKQHKEMQKRLEASDGLEAMTIAEVTRCKKTIADLLLRRETVIQGLRRLGGKKSTGGKKKPQEGEKEEEDEKEASTSDPDAFAALTEAADALMSNGDVDVYTCHKEEFDHAVSMFTPASADTDGDDMFGDSDDEDCNSAKTGEGAKEQSSAAAADGGGGGSASVGGEGMNRSGLPPSTVLPAVDVDVVPPSSAEQQQEDFDSWPISELKRFLEERGENADGIVEKQDLIQKAVEVASKGPEGEVAAAPSGFVYDPSSGYFHSVESGMYFDSGSGSFYVSSTGKWYTKDWQELGVGV
ncbi:hypothetical protein BSKO_10240 [Bryopsis sp. KO-2023]|nr:hypothetical protein BSKO_10240 [Bryopsis sp. KO-2023]